MTESQRKTGVEFQMEALHSALDRAKAVPVFLFARLVPGGELMVMPAAPAEIVSPQHIVELCKAFIAQHEAGKIPEKMIDDVDPPPHQPKPKAPGKETH